MTREQLYALLDHLLLNQMDEPEIGQVRISRYVAAGVEYLEVSFDARRPIESEDGRG